MADKNQRIVTKWKMSKLKVHPRQADRVGDIPEAQLAALTDDLRIHGLQHPIEIVPDGTIIAGHQRVLAAKRLDWKEIDVIVRADLAEAGTAAVERYLVRDNLVRRHLSPLGIARAMQFLMESKQRVRPGDLAPEKKEQLRAEIGRLLGKSGRTVSRYLLILQTPLAVQQAFDRAEISLPVTGRVAMLDTDDQEAIARRIEAGEPARKVVAEFVAARFKDRRGVDGPFLRLLRVLDHEVPLIRGQANEIHPDRLVAGLPALQDAKAVLAELIKAAKRGAA
jgi:ParB-like chromosome segregation protein Spo0J